MTVSENDKRDAGLQPGIPPLAGAPGIEDRHARRSGDTHWSQVAVDGPEAPKQPNERDESANSQAAQGVTMPSIGSAAHADAAGPQVDTDRGPVLDKVYNEGVREEPGSAGHPGQSAGQHPADHSPPANAR